LPRLPSGLDSLEGISLSQVSSTALCTYSIQICACNHVIGSGQRFHLVPLTEHVRIRRTR